MFHCSIFDAGACELWMVLIENNSVQQEHRCTTAARSPEWVGFFSFFLQCCCVEKLSATSCCYMGAKRPRKPTDRGQILSMCSQGNLAEKLALPLFVSVL
ncbi:hypothetical protein AMECASPLE_018801 [Ameca splendens]|uniref:Uncharacterized protein n=1 Tax=Ameca splendens TaxID=208324 RepID=A0ABV0ZCW0_9TELE